MMLFRLTKKWSTLVALAASVTIVAAGSARLSADDTKKAEPAKPAAQQPAKPMPARQGPAKVVTPIGPPTKPVNAGDVPTPTVVLKPGEVPAIKFDTPVYDFGKIKSGTDIKHDFFYTNTGTGPLEILKVRPTCGCTVAGQYEHVIKPGETGKIPITVNSHNASGAITKTITVNTNVNGTDANITLQVKGEVWQPIQVTPQAAAFGRITAAEAGENLTRKLTIVNNLDKPMKPGTPTSNTPKVKATLTAIEEGKKYELSVTMVPPLESGNTSAKITIPTGLDDTPSVDVQAYAFITASVDVTPASLNIPPSRSADLTRQFYIRANAGKAIKITELKSTNPALKLELTDIKDAKTFRLKVDVPKDYQAPTAGDKITFKTDDPSVPLITIPVSAQPALGATPMLNMTGKHAPMTTGSPRTAPGVNPAANQAKPAPATAEKKETPAQPKKG